MIRRCLFALISLTLSRPIFADVVVVASSGHIASSLRPGATLKDDFQVILERGDSLTLLDVRGTRQLHGPGQFTKLTRRLDSHLIFDEFVERPKRIRNAGVRSREEGPTESIISIIDRIVFLTEGGRYEEASASLRSVSAADYSNRIQCQIVENLRMINNIALGNHKVSSFSPCSILPVPANSAAIMEDLEGVSAQMRAVADSM